MVGGPVFSGSRRVVFFIRNGQFLLWARAEMQANMAFFGRGNVRGDGDDCFRFLMLPTGDPLHRLLLCLGMGWFAFLIFREVDLLIGGGERRIFLTNPAPFLFLGAAIWGLRCRRLALLCRDKAPSRFTNCLPLLCGRSLFGLNFLNWASFSFGCTVMVSIVALLVAWCILPTALLGRGGLHSSGFTR